MDKQFNPIVDAFFAKFTKLHYKKGELILRAGDPPPGVLYLQKGFVRMSFVAQNGEMLVLHVFRPGSYFPMSWVLNDAPNRYYFEALTAVEIQRAPRDDANKFIKLHPEVLAHFTERFLSGVGGLLQRMEFLVFESAYRKTILLLLYYAKNFSVSEKKGTLSIPLTHKEIASWIGTTRETASLQIEILKKKKLIEYKKRLIVIPRLDLLEHELSELTPEK